MESIKQQLKQTTLYEWYREFRIEKYEKKIYFEEAKRRFSKENPEKGTLDDYARALKKHRVTYDEYMYHYDMWRLSEKERSEFVSQAVMEKVYRIMVKPEVKSLFCDKVAFLKLYNGFVTRKWLYAPESNYLDFKELVSTRDCIVKPIGGHSGSGIYKICKTEMSSLSDESLRKVFKEYIEEKRLIEECIFACNEIESFHPTSLNTIRVVTISRGEVVRFIGAILRMGAHNSFVDNTHAGGIFAQINLDSGIIESDGVDMAGNRYAVHPDTLKVIKGFRIPHWQKVMDTCKKACVQMPNICFAGWDICILSNGKIELIEGNYAPHFDGGMQVPLKKGVKNKVESALRDLYGVRHLL